MAYRLSVHGYEKDDYRFSIACIQLCILHIRDGQYVDISRLRELLYNCPELQRTFRYSQKFRLLLRAYHSSVFRFFLRSRGKHQLT